MSSTVYFAPLDDVGDEKKCVAAVDAVWNAVKGEEMVKRGAAMAVKMHFGDDGNHRTVPPVAARRLGEHIAANGGRPFATDTTTLYSGRRQNAIDHLMMAAEHGYTLESLKMPVVIADGLRGQDQVVVEINGTHFSNCSLASAWKEVAGFVLLTHLTGHCQVGMGGALKNAAMGWASRGGKRMQHSSTRPEIDPAKCIRCGTCVAECPVNALSDGDEAPEVDRKVCIGCGQCFSVCPEEAIGYDWASAGQVLQEKIAEYATAAVTGKRSHVLGITFLTRITRQCDCMGGDHDYQLPDLGVIASTDLVALDAAGRDLCNKKFGGDFFGALWPEFDTDWQLRHAEDLGLGSRAYELIDA